MDPAERIQVLKRRMQDAQDTIQFNRNQANTAKERREKAERVITICKTRSLSSSAKARADFQLDKSVKTRVDMVQGIEDLRKQRDVLQRRIEFSKEKDAIGKVSKMNDFGSDFRQFCASEITAATEDFSNRLRLQSGCHWMNVYKDRINHIKVAIKVYNTTDEPSLEAYRTKELRFLGGEWPMDLAMELCGIAIRCLSENGSGEEYSAAMPVKEINDVRRRADEDVMHDPHIAADGFSYELEAIEEWLKTGHDTSPMTNLRLKHKILTPNHTLRFLIEDWKKRR